MNEETVCIEHVGLSLEGSLTLPTGTPIRQCVLMIAGSGPLDRNQNSARVQLNLFNAIAAALAEHGIASLRYDKRGCGNSSGDFDSTGHFDLLTDAAAWLAFMQSHPSLRGARLFVLGHSEGTLIAPQLAATQQGVDGLILLSPFVEDFASMIQRQAEQSLQEIAKLPGFRGRLIRFFLRLSGDQIRKQQKLLERIRQSSTPTIKIRKQIINAKWIREMMSLDARAIHERVLLPTLAIGGSKDLQCQPADIEHLAGVVRGPLESHIIDNLTHILRADPEEASTQHYTRLSQLPLDDRVLSAIAHWLSTQSGADSTSALST